ncbi:hypothetical protein D8674_013899 [Pyrus ussuriensis x Pyrus communis]|uniref:Uncharacterized protein n=1 Tax=Pyrus ussuriensis x Pyrus communis TaxID=2448454 RepID=A0A5N5GY60_9ROSA|nr:hypothetical protein D8674_013899 [Pyrus ussuriensis x Pyrus communis]
MRICSSLARIVHFVMAKTGRFTIYREAAKYVVNTKNIEEAMCIFTEGLEPVVSSIRQSGDEMMMASVEGPEYSEYCYRRPRGPREIVSAPF